MDKKFTSDVKINKEKESNSFEKREKPAFLRWLGILVVVLIIIFLGLFVVSKTTNLNILGLKKSGGEGYWQAVFLSNGQVYFGNASNQKSEFITLENIYYLQVTRKLQPAEQEDQQNELSLVKLGNELHGPEDEMRINRSHILFIEDLKPDGKVARAIERYLETESQEQE